MKEQSYFYDPDKGGFVKLVQKRNPPYVHLILFLATFLTSTIAGAQWALQDLLVVSNWVYGLQYSTLLMIFLSVHEFGHYFASKYHGVDASLPYYLPFYIPFFINFGTFGAIIKTRTPIPSRKAMFDIGASGPIAGFIVSVIFLIIGFNSLPPIDSIFDLHKEYLLIDNGTIPAGGLHFGDTLLYWLMAKLFANPASFIPPMNEIYHYPWLCVGWFGLFVTSLNLLPIGQLDGGHITYSMFGRKHGLIARIFWWFMIFLGVLSALAVAFQFLNQDFDNIFMRMAQAALLPGLSWIHMHFPHLYTSWSGWLLWAIVTRFFIKLDHPPIADDSDIGPMRKFLGWLSLLILLMSFSYNGIYLVE